MKGNKQKAEYEEADGAHGKPGVKKAEEREAERRSAAPEKPARGGDGKSGKEEG